jgi:hypothetical protein
MRRDNGEQQYWYWLMSSPCHSIENSQNKCCLANGSRTPDSSIYVWLSIDTRVNCNTHYHTRHITWYCSLKLCNIVCW